MKLRKISRTRSTLQTGGRESPRNTGNCPALTADYTALVRRRQGTIVPAHSRHPKAERSLLGRVLSTALRSHSRRSCAAWLLQRVVLALYRKAPLAPTAKRRSQRQVTKSSNSFGEGTLLSSHAENKSWVHP